MIYEVDRHDFASLINWKEDEVEPLFSLYLCNDTFK